MSIFFSLGYFYFKTKRNHKGVPFPVLAVMKTCVTVQVDDIVKI